MKNRTKNIKYGFTLAIFLTLLIIFYLYGWFVLGLWYFNGSNYKEAERLFLRQTVWNSSDSKPYPYLIFITFANGEYQRSASFILASMDYRLNKQQQDIISDHAIRIIDVSNQIFSAEDLRKILCNLPGFAQEFLNPMRKSLTHYSGRIPLILHAARECGLVNLIPGIEKLVFDDDENIALDAGKTLLDLDPRLQSPVWQRIFSDSPREQMRIANILSAAHREEVQQFYLDILDRLKNQIKSSVILSLSEYPSESVVDKLFAMAEIPDSETDKSLFQSLLTIYETLGPGPFLPYRENLIRYCDSYSPDRWQGAAALLFKLDSKVPQQFIENLRSGNSDDLDHWIRVIAYFRTAESDDIVIPFLSHSNPQIAIETIRAFVGNYSPRVKRAVYNLVQNPNENVAIASLEYIGADPDKSSVSYLHDLVSDDNDNIVVKALQQLVRHLETESVQAYRDALNHPSPMVRKRVAVTCANHMYFSGQLFRDIIDHLPNEQDDDIRFLFLEAVNESYNESATEVMKGLLRDPVPEIRKLAVQYLANSTPSDAYRLALPLLEDPDYTVQVAAIRALLRWNNPAAIPRIKNYMDQCPPAIKITACTAILDLINNMNDKITFLLELSKEQQGNIKLFAFTTLTDYRSPEITERMQKAYDDKEKDVWIIAKRFLNLD